MPSDFESCPPAAAPASLPIPQSITYAVIPGRNASDPWMVNCCDPYPVHVVETCWLWCEISPELVRNTSSDYIWDKFGNCLEDNDRDLNISSGLMIHEASAPP